ncbi:HlyD family secretion protein [Rhizobium sp.]|jgi:RND family efflux transporter MFP subunit|uniref:HlyD family secretion protein n=1 Tax=Rhizobium sp. TaxID=391 RepID=UPI000E7F2138|nr:efflux transporter periplasmic adaptor subunit [Rhizobium sp.]
MNTLKTLGRVCLTLLMVVAAMFVGSHLWHYYMEEPWTRDARVRADVVDVAPDVTGLVSDVFVKDNQTVHKGDVLFRVDRRRFELALAQSEASLAQAKATLDLAVTERQRQERLGDSGSEQNREKAVGTEQQDLAAYNQALASRDIAKLDLERTDVKSTVNGSVTNLDLQPGDFVTRGTAKVAVVDSDSLRIEAYFEENKLPRIQPGDRAVVKMMGVNEDLEGHVDSIATGIDDRERTSSSGLLANINPTFTWVRLAQRVPVRIHLDKVPEGTKLISGRTVTVDIQPKGR